MGLVDFCSRKLCGTWGVEDASIVEFDVDDLVFGLFGLLVIALEFAV